MNPKLLKDIDLGPVQFDEIRLQNTGDGNIAVSFRHKGQVAFVTYAYGATFTKDSSITLSNLTGQFQVQMTSDA